MCNKKTVGYKTNTENSSTAKVSEHILSGFTNSTISSFRKLENKHGVHRGKNFKKRFCVVLLRTQWK